MRGMILEVPKLLDQSSYGSPEVIVVGWRMSIEADADEATESARV